MIVNESEVFVRNEIFVRPNGDHSAETIRLFHRLFCETVFSWILQFLFLEQSCNTFQSCLDINNYDNIDYDYLNLPL